MPVKPNAKKLKRDTVKTDETGFLDFIRICYTEHLSACPVVPPLASDMTYATYQTATGNFNPHLLLLQDVPVPNNVTMASIFPRVEVVQNSIQLETKNLNSLYDSSAVETTLTFKMDNSPKALGFLNMFKRAEVQILLTKASNQNIWVGRPEFSANMAEFTEPLDLSASTITFTFKVSRRAPVYLQTSISTYMPETDYEGHDDVVTP